MPTNLSEGEEKNMEDKMEDKEEMEGKENRKGAHPVSRRSFIKGAG